MDGGADQGHSRSSINYEHFQHVARPCHVQTLDFQVALVNQLGKHQREDWVAVAEFVNLRGLREADLNVGQWGFVQVLQGKFDFEHGTDSFVL